MSDVTTTSEAPALPSTSSFTGIADPTLVPQKANFQMVEPILQEALTRVDDIAIRAKNATDALLEKNAHEAQKFMFHELRAEKLRLEIITKYTELALEARKVVSTEKVDATPTQILNQGTMFVGNMPPEMEQLMIDILGRKQPSGNTTDVSASSLSI